MVGIRKTRGTPQADEEFFESVANGQEPNSSGVKANSWEPDFSGACFPRQKGRPFWHSSKNSGTCLSPWPAFAAGRRLEIDSLPHVFVPGYGRRGLAGGSYSRALMRSVSHSGVSISVAVPNRAHAIARQLLDHLTCRYGGDGHIQSCRLKLPVPRG